MLQIETARPHHLLAPYVHAFVQRDFCMGREEGVEPVVARLGMVLEFQFRDPYWIPSFSDDSENPCSPITVIGPISSRRVRLIVRGNVSALAVIFEPAGFHQLFGVPAAPLAERGTEGHAVLGWEISQLYERLGNATSFVLRVRMLNAFFLKRLQRWPRSALLLHGFARFLKLDRLLVWRELPGRWALARVRLSGNRLSASVSLPQCSSAFHGSKEPLDLAPARTPHGFTSRMPQTITIRCTWSGTSAHLQATRQRRLSLPSSHTTSSTPRSTNY